jgi:hypothetical protein
LNHSWWFKGKNSVHELYHAFRATTDGIPTTYNEAMSSPEAEMWKAEVDLEIKALKDNRTYKIIETKTNDKIIIKEKSRLSVTFKRF